MDTVCSHVAGLNSETLIQSRQTFENAFCFGNGKSRLDFDMDVIKGKGKTFGCNAIYRDMKVDHLITVDNEITHEIYRSGYCQDNHTHIRDWNVLPMFFLNEIKDQYQDANICIGHDDVGFVIHGSNSSEVDSHFEKLVKQNPNIVDEILFFGAPLTASAMAKPKPAGVSRPLPPSKTPGTKKREIRDYGHSSAGYDISPTGQKLYH